MLYLLGLRIEHSTEVFDFWSVFSCVIPANTVSAYLIIEVLRVSGSCISLRREKHHKKRSINKMKFSWS